MCRPLSTFAALLLLAFNTAASDKALPEPADQGNGTERHGAEQHGAEQHGADSSPRDGEWVAEYVEYRFLPDLGQISVADGVVRGERAVARLRKNSRAMAERGVFACTD